MLLEVIGNNIVLLISETKLDASFPSSHFILDGFTPQYRLDRTQHGGGIMLFIREGIPSKLLNSNSLNSFQNHLVQLSKKFDFYSSKYENFIVLGDFNAEMTNTHMEEFCSVCNFKSLIKDPTCFKNPEKPTTIDHILTNHPKCFQHSGVYETGLSDFHRLTLTVLKVFHSKQNPKIIQYRDYKNFTNEHFRRDLLRELSFQNVQPNEFDKFKFIASKLLNSHAPLKEKYIRCNQAVFMNKQLRKAIMTRTRLLNKLRKFNCPENQLAYKRQRNYCVKLLKRSKKDFYNNLNVIKVTDNKHFWKTIKPNFTGKILKDEK